MAGLFGGMMGGGAQPGSAPPPPAPPPDMTQSQTDIVNAPAGWRPPAATAPRAATPEDEKLPYFPGDKPPAFLTTEALQKLKPSEAAEPQKKTKKKIEDILNAPIRSSNGSGSGPRVTILDYPDWTA